uniref:Uncharacterized protein n=1 Tax=Arundo donax TaxID=35708 RepID=A0A0A9AJ07_ARUDO
MANLRALFCEDVCCPLVSNTITKFSSFDNEQIISSTISWRRQADGVKL